MKTTLPNPIEQQAKMLRQMDKLLTETLNTLKLKPGAYATPVHGERQKADKLDVQSLHIKQDTVSLSYYGKILASLKDVD
jgi:hypothetical protein